MSGGLPIQAGNVGDELVFLFSDGSTAIGPELLFEPHGSTVHQIAFSVSTPPSDTDHTTQADVWTAFMMRTMFLRTAQA